MTKSEKDRGRFGARVFLVDPEVLLIMQTIKKGSQQNSPYVVHHKRNAIVQKFVSASNNAEIADAIRAALRGELQGE